MTDADVQVRGHCGCHVDRDGNRETRERPGEFESTGPISPKRPNRDGASGEQRQLGGDRCLHQHRERKVVPGSYITHLAEQEIRAGSRMGILHEQAMDPGAERGGAEAEVWRCGRSEFRRDRAITRRRRPRRAGIRKPGRPHRTDASQSSARVESTRTSRRTLPRSHRASRESRWTCIAFCSQAAAWEPRAGARCDAQDGDFINRIREGLKPMRQSRAKLVDRCSWVHRRWAWLWMRRFVTEIDQLAEPRVGVELSGWIQRWAEMKTVAGPDSDIRRDADADQEQYRQREFPSESVKAPATAHSTGLAARFGFPAAAGALARSAAPRTWRSPRLQPRRTAVTRVSR